jgi:hypothetical protein
MLNRYYKSSKLSEANLDDVFGLQFVTTEFALNNLRIDCIGRETFETLERSQNATISGIRRDSRVLSFHENDNLN